MAKKSDKKQILNKEGDEAMEILHSLMADWDKEEKAKMPLNDIATLINQTVSPLGNLTFNGESFDQAFSLLKALGPKNGLEMMLMSQMSAIHLLSMQSALKSQSAKYIDQNDRYLKQVTRLSRLFLDQSLALQKLRGKGQQKIVVEKINVEPGGQAAVGVYEGGGGDE